MLRITTYTGDRYWTDHVSFGPLGITFVIGTNREGEEEGTFLPYPAVISITTDSTVTDREQGIAMAKALCGFK